MPRKISYINIVLLLALFPVAALLARDYLVYRYASKGIEPIGVFAPPAETAPRLQDFSTVVEGKVFPARTAKLTPLGGIDSTGALKAADASATAGELKLIGLYAGKKGFAIFVRKSTGEEEAFKTGSRVFDLGTLLEVHQDRAIVESGGRTLVFTIPKEEIPQAPPIDLGRPMRGVPEPAIKAPPGEGTLSKQVGERQWVIDQKAVLSALQDMNKVLTDARLTPVVNNGSSDGFIVTEIRPRGIFDAIGLKNGDVLKRVNGYEINSPEKAVQVLSALKGETSIDLDIIRGGSNMSLHYDIQ